MFAASKSGQAAGAAPTPTPDPSFAYVPLLLNTTSTNGQNNQGTTTTNGFLDSSTNNFTITRNGTPTQGSITPYWPNGQWSNFFNGTTDYFTGPSNAAFTLGTGDFTIEAWIFPTSSSGVQGVVGLADGASTGSCTFFYNLTANKVTLNSYLGSIATSTASITLNAWTHIAFSRASGSLKTFINGALDNTTAFADNLTKTAFVVGRSYSTLNQEYFSGYVSNVRVVKGTAVYNSAFTPSTTPLTAITNTSVLTCQSNRFKDNSVNNFTLTPSGTPRVQAFQPFSPTASYTTALYGGSGYFNGSTDFLSSTITAVSPSIAVFECWLYNLALESTGQGNHYIQVDGAQTNYFISNNSSGAARFVCRNDSGTNIFDLISATGVLKINQWQYVVGIRNATTASLYVDGARVATSSASVSTSTGTTLRIGSNQGTSRFLNGYISNVRIQSGTLPSGYDPTSTTIAVPTTPLAAVTGTLFLGNFTNAGIYDAAVQNNAITVGNAQVSTAITAKWPPTSIRFDGNGDYLDLLNINPTLNLGSSNWTIEFWAYTVSTSTGTLMFLQGNASAYAAVRLQVASNQLAIFMSTTGSSWAINQDPAGSIPLSTWTYVAMTRSGTTFTLYVNGSSVYTSTALGTSALMTGTINQIGYLTPGVPSYYSGYLQDFRITRGVARTITTPTAAFPTR
jgi:hypothetical protein